MCFTDTHQFLSKNLIKVKIYLGLLMVTLGMKDDYGQATFVNRLITSKIVNVKGFFFVFNTIAVYMKLMVFFIFSLL